MAKPSDIKVLSPGLCIGRFPRIEIDETRSISIEMG